MRLGGVWDMAYRLFWLGPGLALAACGAPQTVDSTIPEPALEISPNDFVLVPCVGIPGRSPCLVVHAGGKVVLFGAPEGVMGALERHGVSTPDFIFLPDLMPATIEGLPRLRNQTWANGRLSTLPIIGPVGSGEMVAHLNAALVMSDAERFAIDAPPGGFEAALMAAADAPPATGVDTGDLRVTLLPSGIGSLSFLIEYDGYVASLGTCDMPPEPAADLGLSMTCQSAERAYDWPFSTPHHTLNVGES